MSLIYENESDFVSSECIQDGSAAEALNFNKGVKHVYGELIGVEDRLHGLEIWKEGGSLDADSVGGVSLSQLSRNDLDNTMNSSSIYWPGDQDYEGLYWGEKHKDGSSHTGSWGYVRQGVEQGDLEIGSKDFIYFANSDTHGFSAYIDVDNSNLKVMGDIYEGGTGTGNILAAKYLGITNNAVSATKLQTARDITLTGSVTGSVSFDGSGNVSIATATNHTHTEYQTSGGDIHMGENNIYFANDNDYIDFDDGANRFSFVSDSSTANSKIQAGLFEGKSTSSQYADLAEKYESDKTYDIGTVVEVGGEKEITEYNGGIVAGIISENPGLMINSEGKGQYVALKGKVPAKCATVINKGVYCVATKDGLVKGVHKGDMTALEALNIVGVALEKSKDGMVMVKV